MIHSIPELVAFLKHFHRRWMDDPSLDPAAIPDDLPPGLTTIYRELGGLVEVKECTANNWRTPFGAQDVLLDIARLRRIDGMIEFACENQALLQYRLSRKSLRAAASPREPVPKSA
jgi:hypothetical protein